MARSLTHPPNALRGRDWELEWRGIPLVKPRIDLSFIFGSYNFSSIGDARDDEYERFLQWCDDRAIRLHAYHDFEKPKRYYSSETILEDHAFEMRMVWPFLRFIDRGSW